MGLRGYKHTAQAKEKMRIAWVGKTISEETKKRLRTLRVGKIPWNKGKKGVMPSGKNHPMFGRHHTPEIAEKLRKLRLGKSAWNKGKIGVCSSETLIKMSQASKGRLHSEEWKRQMSKKMKGRISPMLEKHQNEEFKAMVSLLHRGENNVNWKGGVTTENEKVRKSPSYKLWRKTVMERDNFTCVSCGQVGGKLNADHIKPFSIFENLRFAVDNGRTLCIDCHRKTDTWGMRVKSFNRTLSTV